MIIRSFRLNMNQKHLLEKCILCKKILDIPKNKPISLREYYIEGAGQLCVECYSMVYLREVN